MRNDGFSGRICGTIKLLALLAMAVMMAGCAMLATTPPQPLGRLPEARWGKIFSYSYKITGQKARPGSVPVTVVVVNPYYKEEESILRSARYSKVGKGFSASMGVDADKILIAKGMRTLGPYLTLDEVIYAHKKKASLTLMPKVFITTEVKYLGAPYTIKGSTATQAVVSRSRRDFQMKIGGWVSFAMMEPLSGEKMWVKKLQLDERELTGFDLWGTTPVYTKTYGLFGEVTGSYVSGYKSSNEIVLDGKVEAVADYLKEMYPVIMGKFWTYLDSEEMLQLKKQTVEIRKLKRY